MTTLTIAYITFRYGAQISSQLIGTYGNVLDLVTDVESVLTNPANQDLIKFGIRQIPLIPGVDVGTLEAIFKTIFGGN